MLTVSNYHYIRTNFDSKFPSIFGITPANFKKQLLLFKKMGIFISIHDVSENTQSILESKENYYLINFDDGLKEQIDLALPILDELQIPALFFANSINFEQKKVSTVHKIHLIRSIIDSNIILKSIQNEFSIQSDKNDRNNALATYRFDTKEDGLLKYILNFKLNLEQQELVINTLFNNHFDEQQVLNELYMSQSDLKYLASKNYLGSHTHSHFPLGKLNETEILFELTNSKNYFENLTNSKIHTVSYPYGTEKAVTPLVAELAVKSGYKLGFTTKVGDNTGSENLLELKRFDCNDLVGGKNYKG